MLSACSGQDTLAVIPVMSRDWRRRLLHEKQQKEIEMFEMLRDMRSIDESCYKDVHPSLISHEASLSRIHYNRAAYIPYRRQ